MKCSFFAIPPFSVAPHLSAIPPPVWTVGRLSRFTFSVASGVGRWEDYETPDKDSEMEDWLAKRFGKEPSSTSAALRARSAERPKLPETAFRSLVGGWIIFLGDGKQNLVGEENAALPSEVKRREELKFRLGMAM